jgi:DNA polymerase-3 subunit epsilon
MSLLDAPVSSVRLAALDFESTGTRDGQTDEPVQIGMAWCLPGRGEPESFFRSYIRPDRAIHADARKVHGIDDEKVQDAPKFASLWPELKQWLRGSVVVAHGVSTEQRFLRAFPFHGFGPWLDTLSISRALMPDIADHSLSTVVGSLHLESEVSRLCPELTWHDALFDAVACLVFLRHVFKLLDQPDMTLGQLCRLDATAYQRLRLMRREANQAGWGNTR